MLYPTHKPREGDLRAAVAGRVVLVTGSSHGIGRAAARKVGAAGATVLLVARSEDELREVAAEIAAAGGVAHVYPADLSEADGIERLAAAVLAAHGRVDVVVNNAGRSIRRSVAETYDRFHDVTRTLDVNYLGPVRLLLALLPGMRERRTGQIVNISTWALRMPPNPGWSAYAGSKAAFDTWLRTVATEVAGDEVAVTSIYMPLVHTRMSAPTDFGELPGLTADEAADLICHALVARPVAISPWWSGPLNAWGELARGPAHRLMARTLRRSPRSRRGK
ncbi:SDR family NAD(P)-dependent oxidoreductase [Nocardia sp. BMG111209]|uniref:SDR family NAD(P)-dependent oxidoreductase n=1 Tax=Nocardia sp. BMG111209 TaxID=1160137 RepID=UPI000377D982|nr:SDR family NAD(P)-dependent oxidoreductase [Nocardia sp. BMG111209]